MAIIDLQNTFAENLSLAGLAAAATAVSTNTYDTGTAAGRDLGMNLSQIVAFEIICMVAVVEAVAGGSLEIKIVSSATAGTLTSPNTHWTSGALDTTAAAAAFPLVLGNRMLIPFPVNGGLNPSILRHIGLTFTQTAQALSTGEYAIHMGRGFHKSKKFLAGWTFA